MPDVLDEQVQRAELGDPWVACLLGLVSLIGKLGDPVLSGSPDPTGNPRFDRRDPTAVHLLLGVVSLQRRLLQGLDELAPALSASDPEKPVAERRGSLLR